MGWFQHGPWFVSRQPFCPAGRAPRLVRRSPPRGCERIAFCRNNHASCLNYRNEDARTRRTVLLHARRHDRALTRQPPPAVGATTVTGRKPVAEQRPESWCQSAVQNRRSPPNFIRAGTFRFGLPSPAVVGGLMRAESPPRCLANYVRRYIRRFVVVHREFAGNEYHRRFEARSSKLSFEFVTWKFMLK